MKVLSKPRVAKVEAPVVPAGAPVPTVTTPVVEQVDGERGRKMASTIRDTSGAAGTTSLKGDKAIPGGAYWNTRLGQTYEQRQARALALLGAPGAEASKAIGFGVDARSEAGSGDVIEALKRMDVGSLKKAGVRTLATLDFDNTLVPGDAFVSFCTHLADAGAVGAELHGRLSALLPGHSGTASELLRKAVDLHVDGKLPAKEMLQIGILSFSGHTPAALREMAREMFVGGYLKNAFAPDDAAGNSARGLVATLAAKGIEPHIVSAGMQFLAQVGAELLGVRPENVFGGELALDAHGKCVGTLAYDVATVGKAAVIKEKIGAPPLFAFGDSPGSDAPMMATALVQGVMCNPNEKFLQKAKDEALPYVAMRWR